MIVMTAGFQSLQISRSNLLVKILPVGSKSDWRLYVTDPRGTLALLNDGLPLDTSSLPVYAQAALKQTTTYLNH